MFLKLGKNPQAKKNTFKTQKKVKKKKTVYSKPLKIISTMIMSFEVLFLMSILVLSKAHLWPYMLFKNLFKFWKDQPIRHGQNHELAALLT